VTKWISSLLDSHVNLGARRENVKAQKINDGSGLTSLESFAKLAPDSSFWKTHQASAKGASKSYSKIWPLNGIMLNGECWELTTLEPLTTEKESGYWPTPRTTGLDGGSNSRRTAKARGMWPTPTVADNALAPSMQKHTIHQRFKNEVGGKLSPTWVEWLMGFPIDWTGSGPSAMEWSRWQRLMRSKLFSMI